MKTLKVLAFTLAGAFTASSTLAATYTATDLGLVADAGTRITQWDVTDTGTITGLSLDVSFSTCGGSFRARGMGSCNSNSHPYDNELSLRLISPQGTTVNLINTGTYRSNSSGGTYSLSFSDFASRVVGSTNGRKPVDGTFRPVSALSALLGETAMGTWALAIGDSTRWDPKRLNSYALSVQTTGLAAAVPLPAGLPLLAAGLGGLLCLRRRRKAT